MVQWPVENQPICNEDVGTIPHFFFLKFTNIQLEIHCDQVMRITKRLIDWPHHSGSTIKEGFLYRLKPLICEEPLQISNLRPLKSNYLQWL